MSDTENIVPLEDCVSLEGSGVTETNPYKGLIYPGDYKYKDICIALGEDIKRCNSKKAQLKRWGRWLEWENPTKQTYRITRILDTPKSVVDGRSSNGGRKGNSGYSGVLNDEFDWLINAYLMREHTRNTVGDRDSIGMVDMCCVRFTGNEISKYFGLYREGFHDAVDIRISEGYGDIADYSDAFKEVSRKIAEKRRSLIYSKIDKSDKFKMSYGIIAYKDDKRSDFEYLDSLLESWDSYMKRYLERHHIKNLGSVADKGMYLDMVKNISLNFDGYESVERVRKVEFDISDLDEFDLDDLGEYRKGYNDYVVKSLERYFKKKYKDDEYALGVRLGIVERYVKLDDSGVSQDLD